MFSSSFTSDESGLEPHGDLLALPLVAGGFTIFIFLLFGAVPNLCKFIFEDEQIFGSCADDSDDFIPGIFEGFCNGQ